MVQICFAMPAADIGSFDGRRGFLEPFQRRKHRWVERRMVADLAGPHRCREEMHRRERGESRSLRGLL